MSTYVKKQKEKQHLRIVEDLVNIRFQSVELSLVLSSC